MEKEQFTLFRDLQQEDASASSVRLWSVFLTARIALAMVLVLIQATLHSIQANSGESRADWIMTIPLVVYFVETIVVRWMLGKGLWRHQRLWLWVLTVGVDLLTFSWLYWSGTDTNSYLSLFMFCILMVASLGPRWLIYLVCLFAAGLLLLRSGLLQDNFQAPADFIGIRPVLLASLGLFVLGELIFQLANRMRREEHRAYEGISSARLQQVLNQMIVAEMGMGVVVADHEAQLKMANPAAAALITGKELQSETADLLPVLNDASGWKQLQEVVKTLFANDVGSRWLVFDFMLEQGPQGGRLLQIKGRLLETGGAEGQRLCVLFLSDMREVDRRMQQEKLAAMGRMSASIAHEIRNPLATITSANTLLSEGLHDKGSLRLTEMISTNAQRLARIVKDVLDVAHMQEGGEVEAIDLLFALPEIVRDWARNNQQMHRVATKWPDDIFGVFIAFDEEHLRRVLINLLDNAARYASQESDAIVVSCQVYQLADNEIVRVSVYSDGAELAVSTEKSLFEPFFSTEARGTGLGLYICRSLCNRYGASLDYQRIDLDRQGVLRGYNEFYITANRVDPLPGETKILIEQTRHQWPEEE
ncbi:sensor histidine kinase [Saezia sanguinis]|uniref:sensor histidine kinase n=1 Tax=Saezia sanguinis TaxID=1965230 RepID=UPI0030667EF4